MSEKTIAVNDLPAHGQADWGLLPTADQQLAGLLMWIPMGGIYLAAALISLGVRLGSESNPQLSSRPRT